MSAGQPWAAAVPHLRSAVAAAVDGRDWSWPDDLDVHLFLDATLRHRVAEVLADSTGLDLPADVRDELDARRRRSRFRALSLARDLARATSLLEEARVRVLVVKGLALAAQTTGDFTARGLGDLDLFVSPDDVTSAHDVLAAAGWRIDRGFPAPGPSWSWRHLLSTYCELPMVGERSSVDLHWHLAPTRGVLPGFEEAWQQREAVDVGGTRIATLGRAHALEHSCAHAMKDNWSWLRSLVDVRRMSAQGAGDSYAERLTLGVVATLLDGEAGAAPARYVRIADRAQTGPPPGNATGFPGTGVPRAIAEGVRGNARPREVARVTYRFVVVPTADVPYRSAWLAIPATLGWRLRRYVLRLTDWRRTRRTPEAA